MTTVTAASRNAQRAIFNQIKVGDKVIIRARQGWMLCEALTGIYTDTIEFEVAEIGKNYVRDAYGQQFSYMRIDRIVR
jgi:hypothetical protein